MLPWHTKTTRSTLSQRIFLRPAVAADAVFKVGKQEPRESAIAAKAGAHPDGVPAPKGHG